MKLESLRSSKFDGLSKTQMSAIKGGEDRGIKTDGGGTYHGVSIISDVEYRETRTHTLTLADGRTITESF